MTMLESRLQVRSTRCTAKVRASPTGDVKVVASNAGATAYGPVEIAWYPDHLEITALGAGRAAVSEAAPGSGGENLVVEIRPPELDELVEMVPGAD